MYHRIQQLRKTRFWRYLCNAIAAVGVTANVVVLLSIFASVLLRYVLNLSLFGVDEIIVMVAYWLYFIGGAYATATDGHIKADLVSAFVHNARVVYVVRFLAKLLELTVTIFFCRWSFRYFLYTGVAKWPVTAGLHIPHIFMMMPLFIGYALCAFLSTFQAIELGCLAFGDYQKLLEEEGQTDV